ncbi:MAG TPA: hypothetical protein VIL48_02025, partial [Acidimicrobiales bacterium]
MSVAAPDVDLRAAARRLRAAVDRDDVDGLHAELTRLRTAVMEQVHAARPSADPPPADPPPADPPPADPPPADPPPADPPPADPPPADPPPA